MPEVAYTGETVLLDSWRGSQYSEHKVARITIKVGDVEAMTKVAVDYNLECPALLGSDLEKPLALAREMMKLVVAQLGDDQPVLSKDKELGMVADSIPIRSTREQDRKEQAREKEDDLASAQAECTPVPLSEILDIPDSYFEEECVATPVEEWSTLPEVSRVDIPLPCLDTTGSETLVAEQQADDTLKKVLALAQSSEKGYGFEQGVLVHYSSDELGDIIQRVVAPKGRRQQILELAHSNVTAGHFGFKKTFGRISRHFLWPRMWGEVKAFVRSCVGCQKGAKNHSAKAPLHPLPCVSEPFEKVAFDLVGPLPKSSSGYRYLLTMMCLYTKYPEAIPLRRVDNEAVLDAMFDIFSRHGLPKIMLTDQGAVFTSKLTKLMCKTFEIQKVQTSPYHPQSDGALERWHACLKGMLKRSECDLKLWDKQLKYLLFAYRNTPHCVTGFSPFTLLFGRDVKGPLELLSSSWLEGASEAAGVGE